MENIELTVKKIVSEQLGIPIDQIKNSMSFIEDLGGDSLDTVEMLLYVEDIYNLNIDEEVAENLSTVQMVIDYITSLQQPT
jgi:acyl carrier protein